MLLCPHVLCISSWNRGLQTYIYYSLTLWLNLECKRGGKYDQKCEFEQKCIKKEKLKGYAIQKYKIKK